MAEIPVELILKLKDEASKQASEVADRLSGIKAAALGIGVGAVAGIGALAAGLYSCAKAASEEEVGIASLGAAVKATGADWDEASSAIEDYLAAQTRRIALDDGAGRAALTTLTTITHDYKRAMDLLLLAADLAAAKNIDLSSAAEIVGRVAEGNVGILSRYGIVVGEGATATEALAAMQATFAGQAEAYAGTYQGAMQRLSIELGNIKETIGAAVLPALTAFVSALADIAGNAIPVVQSAIQNFSAIVGPIFTALGSAWTEALALITGTGGDWSAFWESIESVFGSTVADIVTNALSFVTDLGMQFTTIQGNTETAFIAIQTAIQTVMDYIWSYIQGIITQITSWWNENHELIRQTTETVFGAIRTTVETILNAIRDFWQEHGDTVKRIVGDAFGAIQTAVQTALGVLLGIVKVAMQLINGDWSGAWGTIKGIAQTVWNGIKEIVRLAIDAVKGILDIALPAIRTAWDTAWNGIKTAFSTVWDAIKTAVRTKIDEVKTAITTKIDEVQAWIRGQIGRFTELGQAIIDGLRQGVTNAVSSLIDAVKGVVNDAIAAAKGALGIHSPSAVFAALGADMMGGLQLGMTQHISEVLETLVGIFNQIKTKSAEQAKSVAEAISSITSAINSVLEMLSKLKEYKGAGEYTMWGIYVIEGLNALEMDIPLIIAALVRIRNNINDKLLAKVVELSESLGRVFTGLNQIFEPLGKLKEYRGAGEYTMWGIYVIEGLSALEIEIPLIIAALTRIKRQIDTNVLTQIAELTEALGKIFTSLAKIFEPLGKLKEYNLAALTSLLELMRAWPLALNTIAMELAAALPAAEQILNTAQTIWSLLESALMQLALGMPEKITEVSELLFSFVRSIQDVVALVARYLFVLHAWIDKEFRGMLRAISFYGEGLVIGQSLADGLMAALPAVQAAAQALAAAAQAGVTETLQIGSPSKVMEALGVQAGMGFWRGLQLTGAPVTNQNFTLNYTAVRPTAGYADAVTQMRMLELMARLRRG